MARGDIRQKISLEGGDEVRRQLAQMGQAGEKAFRDLGAATAGVSNAIVPANAALNSLRGAFGSVGQTVANMSTSIFPAFASSMKLGVAAAAAGAVLGFKSIITSAQDSILELRNLSIQSGQSRLAIQGIKDVFEDAGVPVENLTSFVGKFSEELGKAKEEARKAAGNMGRVKDAATVLRGAVGDVTSAFEKEITVMRGAEKPIRDISTAFKSVGIKEVLKFPDTEKGELDAMIAFSRGLINIAEGTERARAGAQLFGRQYRQLAAGILALAPKLEAAMAERQQKGLAISPEDEKRALAYKKSVNDLGDQWDRTAQQIGSAVFPLLSKMGENIEANIQNTRSAIGPFNEMMKAAGEAIARADFAGLGRGLQEIGKIKFSDLESSFMAIPGWVQTAMAAIETARAAGEASSMTAAERLKAWLAEQQAWLATQNQAFWDGVGAAAIAVDQSIREVWGGLTDWLTTKWADFTSGFTSSWDSVAAAFSANIDRMLGWLQWIIDKANAAAAAVAAAFGGGAYAPVAYAPIPPMEQAAGGYIRGPGTGTSDSILARLSDREYVVRAAAVKHFGVGFFDQLNRLHTPQLAMGGLVDALSTSLMPRRRGFASGGLVTAGGSSGGTPVHLHFPDGSSFGPMMADAKVAGAVIRYSRGKALLSAGRKPGWV